MSDYHINIFYSEEDGGYIADIPDLDSCSAFGQTPEQALSEVERAKIAWLEAAEREGKPILRRVTDRSFTRWRGKLKNQCRGRLRALDSGLKPMPFNLRAM